MRRALPIALVVTYTSWGELHRGMTTKEAQHTGMVSTQFDHCAPGYQLTKPFRSRGYLTWNASKKPWKVSTIIVRGRRDHTKEGTHPGTALARLKRQHPHLSKVTGGFTLNGQSQPKTDIWVAWVRKPYGTINYEFPNGARPKAGSPLTRSSCPGSRWRTTAAEPARMQRHASSRASSSSTTAGSSLVKTGLGCSTVAPTVTGRLSQRGVPE